MTISKKLVRLSILLIIVISTLVILNINQNKSTNVPRSATLVFNRMDDK